MLRTPDLDEGDYTHKFSHYFNYVSVLGNGAFGFVVAATDKKTQELSAVKVTEFNPSLYLSALFLAPYSVKPCFFLKPKSGL